MTDNKEVKQSHYLNQNHHNDEIVDEGHEEMNFSDIEDEVGSNNHNINNESKDANFYVNTSTNNNPIAIAKGNQVNKLNMENKGIEPKIAEEFQHTKNNKESNLNEEKDISRQDKSKIYQGEYKINDNKGNNQNKNKEEIYQIQNIQIEQKNQKGNSLQTYQNKHIITTEYYIHFYIKYFTVENCEELESIKNRIYDRLIKIKNLDRIYITEIEANQVAFGFRMNKDKDAHYILDNIKMRNLLDFYDKPGQFPYIEPSRAFGLYMKYHKDSYEKSSMNTKDNSNKEGNEKKKNEIWLNNNYKKQRSNSSERRLKSIKTSENINQRPSTTKPIDNIYPTKKSDYESELRIVRNEINQDIGDINKDNKKGGGSYNNTNTSSLNKIGKIEISTSKQKEMNLKEKDRNLNRKDNASNPIIISSKLNESTSSNTDDRFYNKKISPSKRDETKRIAQLNINRRSNSKGKNDLERRSKKYSRSRSRSNSRSKQRYNQINKRHNISDHRSNSRTSSKSRDSSSRHNLYRKKYNSRDESSNHGDNNHNKYSSSRDHTILDKDKNDRKITNTTNLPIIENTKIPFTPPSGNEPSNTSGSILNTFDPPGNLLIDAKNYFMNAFAQGNQNLPMNLLLSGSLVSSDKSSNFIGIDSNKPLPPPQHHHSIPNPFNTQNRNNTIINTAGNNTNSTGQISILNRVTTKSSINQANTFNANNITTLIEQNPDNVCLLVGIPLEIQAENVINQLKASNFQAPLHYSWSNEGCIEYLRLYFAEKDYACDLLIRGLKLSIGQHRYPILALPYLTDRTVLEMLEFHEIEIKSNAPLDRKFCYMYFNPYGDVLDVVEMENNQTYTIVFAKQDGKKELITQGQLRLPMKVEVIINIDHVNAAVPIKRKSIKDHIVTLSTAMLIKPPPPDTLPTMLNTINIKSGGSDDLHQDEKNLRRDKFDNIKDLNKREKDERDKNDKDKERDRNNNNNNNSNSNTKNKNDRNDFKGGEYSNNLSKTGNKNYRYK